MQVVQLAGDAQEVVRSTNCANAPNFQFIFCALLPTHRIGVGVKVRLARSTNCANAPYAVSEGATAPITTISIAQLAEKRKTFFLAARNFARRYRP